MNTFKFERTKAKTNIEKNQGRTPRHYKTMRIGLVLAAMMFGGVFYGLAAMHTPETEAIEPSSFNAGYLIDDSVFYNPNTMTVAEIQKLLDDKSPACDMWGTGLISGRKYPDGTWVPAGTTRAQYAKVMREKYGNTKYHDPPYVCINKYYENPETHQSLYETQGVATAGMKSVAQIIYDVAQEYSINPQVLLVMIKKESLVWGDNWPLKYEYNTVMGYGCPDNAPCNEAYYGFYNQVQKAAWQLKYYREHPNAYRYKPGQNNNIQYHPNIDCGTKQVYLENIATTSLYIYTPYTPNDAALRAYPGTGDGCSSYGNRNFYMFFREWFGSTYDENDDKGEEIGVATKDIKNSTYLFVPAENLDVALSHNGSNFLFSNRSNNNATLFSLTKEDDGYYKIIDANGSKSLDLAMGDNKTYVVTLWDYHGGDNQKWIFYANGDGTFSIASKKDSRKALEWHDGKLATSTYSVNGAKQKFYLIDTKLKDYSANTYRIESAFKDDAYFDIHSSSTYSGLLSSYGRNFGESDNQTFLISLDATGYYRLKNTYLEKDISILDIHGEKIIASDRKEKDCTQLWRIREIGDSVSFISSCNNTNIAIDFTFDGRVISYAYHGGRNQLWKIEKVQGRPIEPGKYTIKSILDNNYSLDFNGQNNKIIVQNNIKPTEFDLEYDPHLGFYQITSNGLALDLAAGSLLDGGTILSYATHGGINQKWLIVPSEKGGYYIMSSLSKKVLDINCGILTNAKITQWEMNTGPHQRWEFVRQ